MIFFDELFVFIEKKTFRACFHKECTCINKYVLKYDFNLLIGLRERKQNNQFLICFNTRNFLIHFNHFIHITIMIDDFKNIKNVEVKLCCVISFFKSFNFKLKSMCKRMSVNEVYESQTQIKFNIGKKFDKTSSITLKN
jgi:hypothetical protein